MLVLTRETRNDIDSECIKGVVKPDDWQLLILLILLDLEKMLVASGVSLCWILRDWGYTVSGYRRNARAQRMRIPFDIF